MRLWTWIFYEILWIEVGSGLLISMLEKLNWFYLSGLIALVLLKWKLMGLSLRKNHLLRCWGSFHGALIRSMKFLSPEVALYLYKSTILPCMEYCCHFWAGTPSCYLDLLNKLQNQTRRTVGPSLAASLEFLAHRWDVGSYSLFYRHYFGTCSSELAQLVPLPYSHGRSNHYSDSLQDFPVTISRCYKMSISSVSFLARLNSRILWL